MHQTHQELSTGKSFFPWHRHEHEDKLFVVRKGQLQVDFRDHSVTVGPGEKCVVPRGVEHQTTSNEEAEILIYDALEVPSA